MKHGKIFGNKNDDLKGLGHQMDWAMADMYGWIGLGLNKRRGWFYNFCKGSRRFLLK